eukprot:scaffold999_cov289-Pinguiococcus_pyrenoidosus.AAC.6
MTLRSGMFHQCNLAKKKKQAKEKSNPPRPAHVNVCSRYFYILVGLGLLGALLGSTAFFVSVREPPVPLHAV